MSSIEIHNYGSWVGAPAAWGVHDYEDAYLTALDNGWHVMPAAVSDTHDVDWISLAGGPCCWPSDSLATISSMRCERIAATRRWMRTSAFGTRDGRVMGSTLGSAGNVGRRHPRRRSRRDARRRRHLDRGRLDGGRVVASRAANAAAVDWTTTVESEEARYFYVRVTTA